MYIILFFLQYGYREALELKEKKLLYLRAPHKFHIPMKKWNRRWLSFRIGMGLYYEPNVRIRTMLDGKYKVVDNCISEILPWLFVGKVETAANEEFLASRKFTHIMNVTDCVSILFFIILLLLLFVIVKITGIYVYVQVYIYCSFHLCAYL